MREWKMCAMLTVALSALAALPAWAQGAAASYPSKPIRLIVPLAAGGPSDTMARTLAQKLGEVVKHNVIVDNRPGASGIIGTELVAKSAPDGYTILLVSSAISINPSLFRKLPYDTLKDLTAVSLLAGAPYLLAVHPSLPVKNVKQLIALAKARPGELNHASGGSGTGPHLGMEVFMQRTGIKVVHVTYKGGGPALNDFVAGHTQVYMGNMITLYPQAKANRIRALAVTSARRSPAAPDIPTVAESGVSGFEEGGHHGIVAPSGVPKEIIAKLNQAIVAAMRSPDIEKRLSVEGAQVIASSPEEYDALIRRDLAKWAKVIAAAGITPQ
ncbi:MAG TPA: tripartite tricarboxylate transporter substrate binding protein [Burkholderiales bacterium]|nr:tripartite tricarboxylate transporter substrate binding protein [Burkholderiales bacterium]